MHDHVAGVVEAIRSIAGIESVQPDQDFYDAGLTSVMALPLLMELEARFDVAIPDDRFITARTPSAISAIIADLKKA